MQKCCSIIFDLCLLFLHAQARLQPPEIPVANANHVFNAIHSSMRQWGSSLHHNGMSVFIATVPKSTQLYHGTSSSARVNGTEWLAFEPEHALAFARCRAEPSPGERTPPEAPGAEHMASDYPRSRFLRRPKAHDVEAGPWSPQIPLIPEHGEPNYVEPCGYLHTYRTQHDLRLLYLDGQSAAKSSKGTLDMQDIVLLHDDPPSYVHDIPIMRDPPKGHPPKKGRHAGPMADGERATKLCKLAQNEWHGKIDGFLRMELGFEIILCSFERDLDVERITLAGNDRDEPGGRRIDMFSYYRAVASRFDDIGGGRVRLDYESFVSLFSREDTIYFDHDDLPHAHNESTAVKPVQDAISDMVSSRHASDGTNWQVVADMVVARYADRLGYLASGDICDLYEFRSEVEHALRPFIDYGARDRPTEIRRCARQYFDGVSDSTSLAAKSIGSVTTRLCTALMDASEENTLSSAIKILEQLKSWLSWTTWKRCRGCGYHEVCFLPVWPFGGQEDFMSPRCISDMRNTSRGYWGNTSLSDDLLPLRLVHTD